MTRDNKDQTHVNITQNDKHEFVKVIEQLLTISDYFHSTLFTVIQVPPSCKHQPEQGLNFLFLIEPHTSS